MIPSVLDQGSVAKVCSVVVFSLVYLLAYSESGASPFGAAGPDECRRVVAEAAPALR